MAVFEEDKFIVIPTKYLGQLTQTAYLQLVRVLDRVSNLRAAAGKREAAKYYVVNRDEPYAEDVLNIILLGEERKEKQR